MVSVVCVWVGGRGWEVCGHLGGWRLDPVGPEGGILFCAKRPCPCAGAKGQGPGGAGWVQLACLCGGAALVWSSRSAGPSNGEDSALTGLEDGVDAAAFARARRLVEQQQRCGGAAPSDPAQRSAGEEGGDLVHPDAVPARRRSSGEGAGRYGRCCRRGCEYACGYVYVNVCMCVCVYVCMYVCMCACVVFVRDYVFMAPCRWWLLPDILIPFIILCSRLQQACGAIGSRQLHGASSTQQCLEQYDGHAMAT